MCTTAINTRYSAMCNSKEAKLATIQPILFGVCAGIIGAFLFKIFLFMVILSKGRCAATLRCAVWLLNDTKIFFGDRWE